MKPGIDTAQASGPVLQPLARHDFPRGYTPPRAAKSRRLPVLHWRCGRSRCSGPVLCPQFIDKAALGDLANRKEITVASIGSFTKQDDGFNGTLRTLAFSVKVKIVPIDKTKDNGPDYRVLAGTVEIGAAWKRPSAADKHYLSVRLDDPSFPVPVNARLIDAGDGTSTLFWSRRTKE